MTRRLRTLTLGLVAAAVTLVPAAPASAGDKGSSARRTTVAVIGDVPYGTDQEARFGDLIGAVNRDRNVDTVVHVGDFKSGSTTCTDERFDAARAAFDTFRDPVVYTPGDNE